MPKINIPIEISNDIFDEASIQLLKSKVRSIAAAEIDGRVRELIDEAVKKQIDRVVDELSRSYNYYGAKELREKMRAKIVDIAAEKYVDERILMKSIDDFLKPIKDYANQKTKELASQASWLDTRISEEIKSRVDSLFNSNLVAALASVVLSKTEGNGKNVGNA